MNRILAIISIISLFLLSIFARLSKTSSPATEIPLNPAKPTSTPTPTPMYPKTSKSSYTIAIFGDSMVDTMGENLEYLETSLKNRYPNTQFKLYNYGAGAQNVLDGIGRFHQPFSYKTRNYPPIDQIGADIIIIDSFAYNPFAPYDRDKHWQNLINLVETAKATGSKVYLLADIAPLKSGFGKGPGGVNWPDDLANTQAAHIVEQLENTTGISSGTNVPLINVFVRSQLGGIYVNPLYVNENDGIHPSRAGEILTAELIASNIQLP